MASAIYYYILIQLKRDISIINYISFHDAPAIQLDSSTKNQNKKSVADNVLNNACVIVWCRYCVYTSRKYIIARRRARWLKLRAGHKDVVWGVGHLCPGLCLSSAYTLFLVPRFLPPPSLARDPSLPPLSRETPLVWKHTHVTYRWTLHVKRILH